MAVSEREVEKLHDEIRHERDLFISGPTVVFRRRNAPGWPVEYVSDNVQLELGYDPEQFIQKIITYSSIVAPEFIDQLDLELARLVKSEMLGIAHKPYQVITGTGQRRWIRDYTAVITDDNGQTHFHSYVNDITTLKEAQQELQEAHDQLQTVLNTIADPTLVIDVNNYQLTLYNRAASEAYIGIDSSAAFRTCHEMTHRSRHPCTGETAACPIRTILATGKPMTVLHRHINKHTDAIYVEVRATPITNKQGQITQIIESHRDITTHVNNEKKLRTLATTDHLTQTNNRHSFDRELENLIQSVNDSNGGIGIIMIDIDHFKRVNDNHGHHAGDGVLREAASVLGDHIRHSDTLSRWGGEEFVVIAVDVGKQEILHIAEQLRSSIDEHTFDVAGHITISCGATLLRSDDTYASLISRVDDALYEAKENGRNCVSFTLDNPPQERLF
ncbi:MAG: diguanylate cyclase [gamma proteobacterium symbiont of Phacoides pectinatus]